MTARRRGAWCSCARSQGASAGSSPARCVTAKVSAWTVRAAKLAIPNRRRQSGHAGDRRYAWLTVLEWPVQMWNHDAGAVSGGSKHRTAALQWASPGPAPCAWPADYLGGWPTLAILDALAVEGKPRRCSSRRLDPRSPPAKPLSKPMRARGQMGPVAAPEAEAPQRSVGQGTPSLSLSLGPAPDLARRTPAETEPGELSSAT